MQPILILDNQKYRPKKPKIGIYRKILEYEENRNVLTATEHYIEQLNIIADIFGIEAHEIDEKMDAENFLPVFYQSVNFISELVISKIEKLPNVESQKEQE